MSKTTIQISKDSLRKLAKVKANLECNSYEEALLKLTTKIPQLDISEETADRIKSLSSKTLWSVDDYLRVVLDLYEASQKGK